MKASLLLVAACLFTGACVQPEEAPQENPPGAPSLADFLEAGPALDTLDEFLMSGVVPHRCGGENHQAAVERELMEAGHKWAIYSAIDDCSGLHSSDSDLAAARAIENGTEAEDFGAALEAGQAAVAKEFSAINALPSPSNAVEAEVVSVLMSLHDYHRTMVEHVSPDAYALYAQNGQRGDLEHAFLNIQGVPKNVEAALHFMQEYPWQEDAACAPAPGRIQSVMRLYNATLSQAEKFGDPADLQWVSNLYGGLVKVTGPRLDFFSASDWWPAVFSIWSRLDWEHEYWSNYNESVVPPEESKPLIAQYRSEIRSITTEYEIFGMVNHIQYGHRWTENESRRATAVHAMKWHFQEPDMTCSSSGQYFDLASGTVRSGLPQNLSIEPQEDDSVWVWYHEGQLYVNTWAHLGKPFMVFFNDLPDAWLGATLEIRSDDWFVEAPIDGVDTVLVPDVPFSEGDYEVKVTSPSGEKLFSGSFPFTQERPN